jgi:cyclopropane-fatty-acyl-phospholipid synthase
MSLSNLALNLAEKGKLPDTLIRKGIQQLIEKRLEEISANNCEQGAKTLTDFIAHMNASAIAKVPGLANAQHYEVPEEFFFYCLGTQRKYSGCFWMPDTKPASTRTFKMGSKF